MGRSNTPISTLFDLMKRYYGISHKELASIILSGRPLSDGRSPASRVDDRTWISRFVVHARPDSLQPELFGDFSVGGPQDHRAHEIAAQGGIYRLADLSVRLR